eukprot:UN18651
MVKEGPQYWIWEQHENANDVINLKICKKNVAAYQKVLDNLTRLFKRTRTLPFVTIMMLTFLLRVIMIAIAYMGAPHLTIFYYPYCSLESRRIQRLLVFVLCLLTYQT